MYTGAAAARGPGAGRALRGRAVIITITMITIITVYDYYYS